MAAYGLLGVDPEPPTAREQGRFARGRYANEYFGRQLVAKHGEDDVILEKAVPWPPPPDLPIGELHIDAVVRSAKLGIEAKNSKWVDAMFDAAVTQIAGGVHFDPELETGLVVFLDGDFQVTDEFPVFLTDELIEKVEGIAAAVVKAGQTGELPERVCEKKADARGHFCPFADHCFADFEQPEAEQREELSILASEAWIVYRELKDAKGSTAELQKRWDEMKERLLAAELPAGVTVFAGPVNIKRIDVKGRETFSLAKAKTAGIWTGVDDERFHAFTKIGEPSVRFDLTRTEADLDLDFGDEVPF